MSDFVKQQVLSNLITHSVQGFNNIIEAHDNGDGTVTMTEDLKEELTLWRKDFDALSELIED